MRGSKARIRIPTGGRRAIRLVQDGDSAQSADIVGTFRHRPKKEGWCHSTLDGDSAPAATPIRGHWLPPAELRKRLWANGYRPVAVTSPWAHRLLTRGFSWEYPKAGKEPASETWLIDARRTPPAAVIDPVDPDVTNTGILCDGLRGIDIDIDHPALAAACDRLIVDRLGSAPRRFRSNSGRCLRLYRAAEGSPRHRLIACPNLNDSIFGPVEMIEVGGHGDQVVAFGEHPSGAILEWESSSPLTVHKDELTAITEQQVTELFSILCDMIGAEPERQAPAVEPDPPKRITSVGVEPTLAELLAADPTGGVESL